MSMQTLLDTARHGRSALPKPFLPFFKQAAASVLKVGLHTPQPQLVSSQLSADIISICMGVPDV